jgi:hypothetical protein
MPCPSCGCASVASASSEVMLRKRRPSSRSRSGGNLEGFLGCRRRRDRPRANRAVIWHDAENPLRLLFRGGSSGLRRGLPRSVRLRSLGLGRLRLRAVLGSKENRPVDQIRRLPTRLVQNPEETAPTLPIPYSVNGCRTAGQQPRRTKAGGGSWPHRWNVAE